MIFYIQFGSNIFFSTGQPKDEVGTKFLHFHTSLAHFKGYSASNIFPVVILALLVDSGT